MASEKSRAEMLADLRELVEDWSDRWRLQWQQERELLKIVQANERKAVASHALFTADAAVARARELVGLTGE